MFVTIQKDIFCFDVSVNNI